MNFNVPVEIGTNQQGDLKLVSTSNRVCELKTMKVWLLIIREGYGILNW